MILLYSDQRARFEAVCSYFERATPKENRFRWDAANKVWYAPTQDIAERLKQYARGVAALRLGLLSADEQRGLRESQADDAAIEVPCPPGLEYLPYQRAGIAYALKRSGTLLGDEMGLGKTVQAIGVVNCLPETRRVLICCPASLRLNWLREWRRWHTGSLRPRLLDTWPMSTVESRRIQQRWLSFGHETIAKSYDREGDGDGQALICSWDSVKKWHPMIAAVDWDVFIGDEAHGLKDERTRRAKAVFGGKYKGTVFQPIRAKKTMLLTGTAIVNRPNDLWPLVKALAPQGLGANRRDFEARYCLHPGLLDELHVKLRAQCMVRRLKADVLTELPAKRRQVVLLDVPDAEHFVQIEEAARLEYGRALARAKAEASTLPHAEAVQRLRQCRGMAMTEISRIRRESAIRKLPAAVEHIYDILGNVPKLVVWAHHATVVDGLVERFGRISVVLDGRTELARRQEAVDRFQTDRGVRIFIGSIRAGGLGITLTAASTVVFVELDWTPAAMMQAEDRCHRIGQHNSVLVQHLVVDGSIDAKMAKILIGKQEMMDRALDGGSPEERQRSVLDEVLAA